ncbi:hypothetical protein APHAL10511_005131 [Amanita phalloides]|nr:hypothetical protein APHAL10511_005131 [Amanita phalloides]
MASETLATASATAPSTPTHTFFQRPVIVFFVVVGGIMGLCILVAILLLLLYAHRRRQARNNALARLSNNEKGGSDTWLPTHERQTSDGQLPLLTMTDSRFSDSSVRKPHYRLVSESRPLQSVDYVVDIGRQSNQIDSEDEDEEGRSQTSAIPRISFPIPLPSPMSQKEIFIVKPEDPTTPARRVPEWPLEPSDAAGTAVAAQAQKSSAPEGESAQTAVSRSSTLSTASLYSQQSIPSPLQETTTPSVSVSAFPLPPPTSPHEHWLSQERQADQTIFRSNTVMVSHLLQERARVPSLVPAIPPRSPNRPSSRDTDTSTLVK